MTRVLVTLGVVVTTAVPAAADSVTCSKSAHAFARDYCAVSQEPSSKGWVRAKARLDQNTGELQMTVQLETDNLAKGPCGTAAVTLLDAEDRPLASIDMGEAVCRGGKPPGRAVKSTFPIASSVPRSIARRTASMIVTVKPTGSILRIWNVSLDDVANAVKVVLLVTG